MLKIEPFPSPNTDPRAAGIPVDILLMHYTGMETGDAARDRLCDPEWKVSSHYLVYEDGRILQLVDESLRARHAGVSHWAGETDINSASIGIEIVNGGHDFGCPPFPEAQMAAVRDLSLDILGRHPAITPDRVIGHSDVAPTRKQDPGELFDWKGLAEAGVGLWVEPEPISEGPLLRRGDEGEAVRILKTELATYGYGVDVSDTFCGLTEAVVTAFQRHFRQSRVDGVADRSTLATLRRLLEAKASLGS